MSFKKSSDDDGRVLRKYAAGRPAIGDSTGGLGEPTDEYPTSRSAARELRNECYRKPQDLGRIKSIVERDANTTVIPNDERWLALHIACKRQAPLEVIKYLVEKGGPATVKATNEANWLPLHVACRNGAPPEVVLYLAQQYPGSVRAFNGQGKTPLHYARESGVPPAVVETMEAFADGGGFAAVRSSPPDSSDEFSAYQGPRVARSINDPMATFPHEPSSDSRLLASVAQARSAGPYRSMDVSTDSHTFSYEPSSDSRKLASGAQARSAFAYRSMDFSTESATRYAAPDSRGDRHRFQPDPTTRPPPAPPVLTSFEDAPPSREAGGDVRAQPVILQGSSIQPFPVQGSSNPTPRFQNPRARPRPEYHASVPTSTTISLHSRNLTVICVDIIKACVAMGILCECFSEIGVANFRTCEYVRLRLALWLSDDGVLVELHRKKGDSLLFHRYSSILLQAAMGRFDKTIHPSPFSDMDITRQLLVEETVANAAIRYGQEEKSRDDYEDLLSPFKHAQYLLEGRADEVYRAMELLKQHTDISRVGIKNAVLASLVVLFGRAPAEEGNDICQDIHEAMMKRWNADFGASFFEDEMSDDEDMPYEILGFGATSVLQEYRNEVFCLYLNVMVNAIEVCTNKKALEVARVYQCTFSDDFGKKSMKVFGDIIANLHESIKDENNPDYGSKAAETALAFKGLRHLASVAKSEVVAFMRQRQGGRIEAMQAAQIFGSKYHSVLAEQTMRMLRIIAAAADL